MIQRPKKNRQISGVGLRNIDKISAEIEKIMRERPRLSHLSRKKPDLSKTSVKS